MKCKKSIYASAKKHLMFQFSPHRNFIYASVIPITFDLRSDFYFYQGCYACDNMQVIS